MRTCECGCGQAPPLATKTRQHLGTVKGEPIRFVPGHANLGRLGAYKKERWTVEDRGYISPCWVWLLAQIGKGYGCEWDNSRKRMVGAHILAYERAYGPVPEGLEIDHLCRNPLCVNPEHLEAVTHAENVRRSDHKSTSFNSKKTHCPQGHPYAGDNLVIEKSGCRKCKACRRAMRIARKTRV